MLWFIAHANCWQLKSKGPILSCICLCLLFLKNVLVHLNWEVNPSTFSCFWSLQTTPHFNWAVDHGKFQFLCLCQSLEEHRLVLLIISLGNLWLVYFHLSLCYAAQAFIIWASLSAGLWTSSPTHSFSCTFSVSTTHLLKHQIPSNSLNFPLHSFDFS